MSTHPAPNHFALPAPGPGTWKIPDELTSQVVHQAIEAGYRHPDCAADSGNEVFVGKGIARIKPAVLQVEMHPFLCQANLLRFCREHEIAITAFSPIFA